MKTIRVKKLTAENFQRYGTFAMMIDPKADATGPTDAPVVFYRDMIQQELFGFNPSYSVCRMTKRPFVINVGEYHNRAAEGCMPIDQDALIWFAPAGAEPDRVPVEQIEAFFVPKGMLIVVRPGVWHHALYALTDAPLNVFTILPERCYATDCFCFPIPKKDQIKIDFDPKRKLL